MTSDEMTQDDARDREIDIIPVEKGAGPGTDHQKTKLVIVTGTEEMNVGIGIVTEITRAVEGNGTEVKVRRDIDLRRVGLRHHQQV